MYEEASAYALSASVWTQEVCKSDAEALRREQEAAAVLGQALPLSAVRPRLPMLIAHAVWHVSMIVPAAFTRVVVGNCDMWCMLWKRLAALVTMIINMSAQRTTSLLKLRCQSRGPHHAWFTRYHGVRVLQNTCTQSWSLQEVHELQQGIARARNAGAASHAADNMAQSQTKLNLLFPLQASNAAAGTSAVKARAHADACRQKAAAAAEGRDRCCRAAEDVKVQSTPLVRVMHWSIGSSLPKVPDSSQRDVKRPERAAYSRPGQALAASSR